MPSSRSLLLLLLVVSANARTVNISNAWFLPQENYPVFYRYFRDRITWFEADAVCQFHHASLVTVETSAQFDATRAYLKELDVNTNVWIGLKRSGPNEPFLWPNYNAVAAEGGSWLEQSSQSVGPQCAATDPAADFRWHSLGCGGPAVASFICELPVPPWARAEDGCLLTSLPSLTVTYLPEQAAVELSSDCGLDGTRQIACKGQASAIEMERQLSCDQEVSTQDTSTVTQELQTRQRRDTDPSTQQSLNSLSTLPYTEVDTSDNITDIHSTFMTTTENNNISKSTEYDNLLKTETTSEMEETKVSEDMGEDVMVKQEQFLPVFEEETNVTNINFSSATDEPLQPEPEILPRPNRGRRLTRPQGHSFYPYFLNRVLG